MDTITSPGMSARETGSFHARQTAGRTPTSNVSVSAIQPPDTVQQLADTANCNIKTSAADGRDATNLETTALQDGRPSNSIGIATAELSVREDNDRAGLPPDSLRVWPVAVGRGAGYPGVPGGSAESLHL